jgi:hypothetical protein
MYKILAEKAELKIPLGRPRHRWEDNIKMVLKNRVWIGFMLIQYRALVTLVIELLVCLISGIIDQLSCCCLLSL